MLSQFRYFSGTIYQNINISRLLKTAKLIPLRFVNITESQWYLLLLAISLEPLQLNHHINIQDFESNNDLQVFHYEELVTDYNEYQYQ